MKKIEPKGKSGARRSQGVSNGKRKLKCTGNEALDVFRKKKLRKPQQTTEVFAICGGLRMATNSLIFLALTGEFISLPLKQNCL